MPATKEESTADQQPRRSSRARKPNSDFAVAVPTTSEKSKKNVKKKPVPAKKNVRRSSAKRTVNPKFLTNEAGEQVWISQATLQDIQTASKRKSSPYSNKKTKYLVNVSSPQQRELVYDRAARALADLEEKVLPRYGGRLAWTCRVTFKENAKPSPYFVWNKKGMLELATFPHLVEKMPVPPEFPGFELGTGSDLQEEYLQSLQQTPISALSKIAWAERWRVPVPTVHYKWISPMQQSFSSRKAAWDHAIQLCKNEVQIDKQLSGITSSGSPAKLKACSQKMALRVGKLRFERDGLWVVGQEEIWGRERIESSGITPNWAEPQTAKRKWTGLSYFLHCERKPHRERRILEFSQQAAVVTPPQNDGLPPTTSAATDSQRNIFLVGDDTTQSTAKKSGTTKSHVFTLRHAEQELRQTWKSMGASEQALWVEKAKQEEESDGRLVAPSVVTEEGSSSDCSLSTKPSSVPLPAFATPTIQLTPESLAVTNNVGAKAVSEFYRSKKWTLNQAQILACYEAGLDHYDTIMNTVTARDLTLELADGFDLLRERGRGRFDMELPKFDTKDFWFLNDTKKSPWMPIVREILGKDVVLIHKGMFLSMPGSEKQRYHQDGPHLTISQQKPCHAINVFVPLVDLVEENGPTEFCLGSHMLGHEELDEDYIVTPKVVAGTPVIFDYRLGHRGLANSSATCRPIVYCTYAAASNGREFRDSENFSRKRYHRIGDLVAKGMSRGERAQKRMRSGEEVPLEEALASIAALEAQSG